MNRFDMTDYKWHITPCLAPCYVVAVVVGAGMRSGAFDLFPKDENRETEVCGFRFFVSGVGIDRFTMQPLSSVRSR